MPIGETTQDYELVAQKTLRGLVDDFTLTAGDYEVLPVYQINETGFRPFMAAKASPEQLQAELDRIVAEAQARGTDLGLESENSLRKLLLQNGLGIDCSNFGFNFYQRLFDELGLGDYCDSVFWDATDVKAPYLNPEKPNWKPRDAEGNLRDLTPQETEKLFDSESIEVSWIAEVFGKDPVFITGSKHMTRTGSSERVKPENITPGDMITFSAVGSKAVSHIAIVEKVAPKASGTEVDFRHSWHTRNYDAGIRDGSATIENGSATFTDPGLNNPERYEVYNFMRPARLATYLSMLHS